MSSELLKIVPTKLQFHFESNKQISCSVHLINKTDINVASKVKLRSQKKSVVRPNAVSGARIMRVTPPMVLIFANRRGIIELTRLNSELLHQFKEDPKMNLDVLENQRHPIFQNFIWSLVAFWKYYFCAPVCSASVFPYVLSSAIVTPRIQDRSWAKPDKTFIDMAPKISGPTQLESHASSTKASVPDNHLFDMLPVVSLTTKGINLPQFQVFINFRGDELRNTFVGFLVKAMRLEKINVFTDEVEVRGTTLSSLFSRIETSKVAVAIFSERYTESRWCLDELVKMNEQMEQGKLVVVPVFYKLEPSACAYLDGTFGDKFRKLEWEYRSEPERIKKWKEALSSVSKIMGLKLGAGSDESKFVDLIVEEVGKVLIKILADK